MIYKNKFTIISNVWKTLTPNEHHILMWMIDYSARFTNENNEWFFKSIDDMVEDTGIKKRNLQYSLKSLKEKGLIQSCRVFNKSNYYKVMFEKCDELCTEKIENTTVQDITPKTETPVVVEEKAYQYLRDLEKKGEYDRLSEEIDRIYPILDEKYKRGFRKDFMSHFYSKNTVREIEEYY